MGERRARDPSGNTQDEQIRVSNIGEPLRFKNVEPLAGFAAESVLPGQSVRVCTRLALNSDQPIFHRLAENLDGVVRHMSQKIGVTANLRRANTVLLILKPDCTAELWLDTAAVSIKCSVKRSLAAGSAVFDSDIADVVAVSFPCVSFGEGDKVLCLFREGWSFGLAFDFNPAGKLDCDGFSTALGTLYRTLRYRHLYEVVQDQESFGRLQLAGWFPFVEIMSSEFRELAQHVQGDLDIAEVEAKIIAAFTEERLAHLLQRWAAKPHFAAREKLLRETIDAFVAKKPASVIKIVLTEIEGVLRDAYRAANAGQGTKLKGLLEFAQASAEQRAGGKDTLLLPADFCRYLATHTYANFDPTAQSGTAGSRHAVGHGAAAQDSYTMTRAIQAILTLDQLAFYT